MEIKKYKVFMLFVSALLVTAILLISMSIPISVALTPEMYWKPNSTDYAPSGMPDFDQRQPGWNATGIWSWCAPAAVANSLWWMDSRYERSTTPPPTKNGTFPLVSNYTVDTGIDDHDPANVVPFIKHLAYLMDTDGIRTGTPHKGTNVFDMQAGIAQYLSWTGLNPLGDANGDGMVDVNDETIVTNAMGSVPGNFTWDLAADIWPETVTGPYTADNIVDSNDLNLVTANMNKTGMFYEQTVQGPEFYFIEEEVERSEDVILLLGFYREVGGVWEREWYPYEYESGHAVTVAGVNSTTMQIAISDPIQDNAEPPPQGTSGPGRVLPPPPHPHGPGPFYPLHNNASYVSQDIYNVTWAPPGVPANFTLVNYTSPQYPGVPPPIAVVEWAVIVSPLERARIESCDSTGVNKDLFNLNETVYVNGSGYSPSTTYDIYIVNDVTSWSDGMKIPTRVSGTITTVSSNSTGDIPPTAVWSPDLTLGKYDIVVDVNGNGIYDANIDALDDNDIQVTAGFSVIPEFSSLIILPLFMTATLLAAIVYRRQFKKGNANVRNNLPTKKKLLENNSLFTYKARSAHPYNL